MLGDVLRGTLTIDDYEYRLRTALHVLKQWSLATYNKERDSYSIHPLVHAWLRERPQMRLSEQAVWSQAATDTLAQSISLPIYGSTLTKEEMELQRSLLLHVIHLRDFKNEIREKFCENRRRHGRFFSPLEPKSDLTVMDRHQAMHAAKFSYTYFICDYWGEAEKLQEAVRDFLVPNIGLEHEMSMRISLFLAKTYCFGDGRFNDAATLIEQVLQAAEKTLGDRHSMTLDIMNELGTIRNFQGRFPEAEDLFQKAIKGRIELLGAKHQDTLCSIDNLGQVYWSCFEFDKAKNQHLEAIAGMESHPQMGSDHEKTLSAKENLALAYREMGEAHYMEAHELMEEVVAKRLKLFGREAPFTLIAQSNLAYVKHAMGDDVEAEKIIRRGLIIADRNLGEDHLGVMASRRRLAEILTAQKKYDEAGEIFKRLLDHTKYTGGVRKNGAIKGDYKDRIFTLYHFVQFWEKQDNIKEAVNACDELCEILEKSVHPIARIAEDKRKDLRSRSEGMSSFPDSGRCGLGPTTQARFQESIPSSLKYTSN
jgi:tetratricopeptide (TPR) repeat protein